MQASQVVLTFFLDVELIQYWAAAPAALQHPCFFGYFPLASSFPSMLGDSLSSGLGVVSFQWEASPAATELEVVCVDWLAKLLALPACFLSDGGGGGGPGGGVILNSASEGVLVALLAAKARALRGRPPEVAILLVAYTSDQARRPPA